MMDEAIRKIAKKEKIAYGKAEGYLRKGELVIFHNLARNSEPCAVGKGVRTKVNANIGTSPGFCDLAIEMKKAETAVEAGADTIMDLSIAGNLDETRKRLLEVPVAFGTVPVYQAFLESKSHRIEDVVFKVIERHLKDGVDFLTVHAGVTKRLVRLMEKRKRIMPVVSRGGCIHAVCIEETGNENPLFKEFDYLLEIAKKYEATLSLGDGLRPGCLADANDALQIGELRTLAKLVERARKENVQVIVEGPGHMSIDRIAQHVKYEKRICKGAPYYLLGPLVTDIGAGHDHITGAIGGAIAGAAGADFLCYVTPSEHLALPTIEDVREGVIASKIAAHAADIAKGIDGDIDCKLSKARAALDWEGQFGLLLDPKKARESRKRRPPLKNNACSMCSDLCPLILSGKYFK